MQALGRAYLPADNRAMLSALNDSLLREFVKLLPVLREFKPSTALQSTDGRVLSHLLSVYSHELSYVLSRHNEDQPADSLMADKLCCKMTDWLPCVADVCHRLLTSDNVS